MGHGSSRSTSPEQGVDLEETEPSRRRNLRRRFRFYRCSRDSGSNPLLKNLNSDDFAGIVCIELICAQMNFKDKWFACLSLGERTYRTATSDHTETPVWKSKLLLERDGPNIARISVFETNRLSKNNMVGYCEIDLFEVLSSDSISNISFTLADPLSSNAIVGTISLSFSVEDPIVTEQSFARRVLAIVDYNQDGILSLSEFSELITAFGNQTAISKKEELFREADKNGDGAVSVDELAILLAGHQEKELLISACPVCGEKLEGVHKLNVVIHLTLCFDEGTGNQVMTGGFLTEKQASFGWLLKLSEWAHFSSYDIGLRSGSNASHILVFDRITKRLVEEVIDGKIILSMRAIYQSKIGLTLIDKGAKSILQGISEKQGKKMSTAESAKKYQNLSNSLRELKNGARPIAFKERDDIATCAADCRLTAFESVDDSLRFWIKGRKFSIRGLLGAETYSSTFDQGSLVIFRLAPQDYHRFHSPVSGVIEKFVDILDASVNSNYCNVFTENKRAVSVAFVAVGATMVGSITFVKKDGEFINKGDQFGYFSFGGSTVICDAIEIDKDLLSNSRRSLETLVRVGMRLGVSRRSGGPIQLPRVEDCALEG
ncbi:unnamed protein product [Spirodela intermedia]|uniref:Uncharacterized protein n=1 Tax=Spirodela intermedia TaxID=51605 RepID=A0A7I8IS58_SPIIN|nr:unnamed protein product [Spirodela intermedia]CAA6660367.1 unnamed protein product [Spirodela intermedia]